MLAAVDRERISAFAAQEPFVIGSTTADQKRQSGVEPDVSRETTRDDAPRHGQRAS
jgi:hypothetical protein